MNRIGQTLGGKFTLNELVGRSELGAVYKAQTSSGTAVAVKVLHSDLDPTLARALLGNSKAVSQLRNQRIARVLGAKYSRTEDTFIVTEWLAGKNLANVILDSGALGPLRAANLIIQICSALSSLHSQNIPHANLKPTNVFLDQRQGVDAVTIVDAVGSGVLGYQESGEFIGITKHLAPEQLQGLSASIGVDFFNLGVLAYFLVTGSYPFAAPTPSQTADRIKSGQYRSLLDVKPNIDPSYATFIDRCLQTGTETQFTDLRTAAEFIATVKPTENNVGSPTQSQSDGTDSDNASDSAQEDPDATMAFLVPEELQAFFDEQDLDDAPPQTKPDSWSNDEDSVVRSSTSESVENVQAEAPFFTAFDGEHEIESVEHTMDASIDLASVELSLGPNQEMDDDLPFHSVSVSQSVLDQEVSIIEESEAPAEITSHQLGSMAEETLEAAPGHLSELTTSSTEPGLETDDIMEALRSTMEAIGPLDLDKKSSAEAPVMAVSDFEVLATNEFERTANNENRFLSAKAQTGLKRPIFTLFLLVTLAFAALLFQNQFEQDELDNRKRLQKIRQQRILQLDQAQSKEAPATPKGPQDPKATVAPSDRGGAKDNQPNSKRALTVKNLDTKPTPDTGSPLKAPAKPQASTTSKKTPPTKPASAKKSNKRDVKKSNKRGVKKPNRKRRSEKKAPKVEIVDPFANP
jgi:serine/threonine protein kinase